MRLHARAGLRVERAERLVHQQDARLVDQRARDGQALAHAARQLMRVGIGEFGEAHQFQPQKRVALGADVPHAVHLRAEHHVLFHREPREQRVALKHHAAILAGAGDGLAVEQHLAAALSVEAGERADQRGFAAAGRADDADELAPMHLKIDIAQRLGFAARGGKAPAQVAHVENHLALLEAVKPLAHGVALREIGGDVVGGHGGHISLCSAPGPTGTACARDVEVADQRQSR